MKFPVRYFVILSLFSLLIGLAIWGSHSITNIPNSKYATVIILMLYLVTFLSHMFVRVAAMMRGKPFIQMVILSMVIRITVYALLAMLLMIFSPEFAHIEIAYFGILYLLYTVFELVEVVRNPIQNDPPK